VTDQLFHSEDALAQLFFDRLMESLPDHVYFKDREGRFLCLNMPLARFFGLSSPVEAIGKSDYDFFPAELARAKDQDEREIVRTGIGFIDKEEKSDVVGGRSRWDLTSKLPLFGENGQIIGTFGISREITEMKLAREALQQHHELLQTLIEILPCRIFVKDHDGRIRLTNAAYRKAIGAGDAASVEGRRLGEIVADARAEQVEVDDLEILVKGRKILNREEFDASPVGDKRWMLLSKVPLRGTEGEIQGLVGMAADITAQKEAEAHAVRAQRALEEKNREIEGELALARELQTELMASSVQSVRSELDSRAAFAAQIAFHYEPCAHLAGDFFQLIPIDSHRFGLLLCDVMGHGVKAALVTTLIRGLLADLKVDELNPARLLERLNARLCPLLDRPPLPRFVTALYASIDTAAGRVDLASAGHPWPLHVSPQATAGILSSDPCGPALGLIFGACYQTVSRPLERGERILFYTDGWSEETDPAGEEFGRERLAEALARHAALAPDDTLEGMAAEVRTFSGRDTRTDDLCAILAAL
jgi:phosphoserine phosphatase RsbU/P